MTCGYSGYFIAFIIYEVYFIIKIHFEVESTEVSIHSLFLLGKAFVVSEPLHRWLVLNMANLNLTLSIPYGALSLIKIISEHKAKSFEPHQVSPNTKNKGIFLGCKANRDIFLYATVMVDTS